MTSADVLSSPPVLRSSLALFEEARKVSGTLSDLPGPISYGRIFTSTVFWPMIRELYGAGSGKIVKSDAELILLVRRWMIWDWLRVALIAVGFAASVRRSVFSSRAMTAEHTGYPAL